MRLPPEPVLVAVTRWLEILPTSGGVARAQALLTNHTHYSDLTPTQYATALSWIQEMGLLATVGSTVPAANRVLSAIFERAAPAWVRDADGLVRSPDELPSDIVSAGKALEVNADVVFAQLVSSWGKVDTSARERVGAAGEAALVALLSGVDSGRVDHVSTWSDGFGYDIAFAGGDNQAHLEVKSTTRAGRFTAYLSRHEHSVMLRDDRWMLVTVRLNDELEIVGVGSVPNHWIAANAPGDEGQFGSWASVKLEIPIDAIVDGIPQLGEVVADVLPSW